MKKQGTKKDKDMQKTLSRIFIVFILLSCVVGFSLTFSFFSIFKKAEAGDYVIVDYTLSFENGAPIISSSQSIVENGYKNGFPVAMTNQLILQAGALQNEKILPVDAYVYPEGMTQYALIDLELDAISSDVIGMHEGDVKKIDLEFADGLTQNMTAEEYNSVGGNFTEAQIGLLVPLAFNYYPDTEDNSTETSVSLQRPSVIVEKTEDNIVLRYGYALAEIQISQIG
ncbi:MAG: hypothetical protein JXQ82_03720 [Methanomicrobiaceae archaeon]|nr:hypothetical protein [Methanomicrobiaceae archaeon]